MTAQTPLFQLPYMAQGDPAYLLRQLTEDLAGRLEAILQTKAVSPPGASDLLAVAGRVTSLEGDQAAEDALATRQAVSAFGSSFAQFASAPYTEQLRVWKAAPDVVRLQGMIQSTAAVAAQTTSTGEVLLCRVPIGFRPPTGVTYVRHVVQGGSGTSAPTVMRVNIPDTGQLNLQNHVALASGTFIVVDLSWRTSNP